MPSTMKRATAPSGVVFTEQQVGWDFGPVLAAMVSTRPEDQSCGFAVPFFALDAAQQLAKYLNDETVKSDTHTTLFFDAEKRTFTLNSPNDNSCAGGLGNEPDVIDAVVFDDGVERWEIGTGWTWGVLSAEELEELEAAKEGR